MVQASLKTKLQAVNGMGYSKLQANAMQQYPEGRTRSVGAPPTGRFSGPFSGPPGPDQGRMMTQRWTEGTLHSNGFSGPPGPDQGRMNHRFSEGNLPAFLPGAGGVTAGPGPRPMVSATLPRNGLQGGRRQGPTDPFMEMERMKRTMAILQEQLALADNTIQKLKSGDKISGELQNGVAMGGRFENIAHGGIRPSHIIERYGNLYSQGRLNAMDDLDQIDGLSKYGKHSEMKQKILYGIMVASYKVALDYISKLKTNLRILLGISEKHTPNDRDAQGDALTFLTSYFQTTAQTFNLEPITQDVQDQLIQLLPEFPSMYRLPGVAAYSAECCRVAWAMVNTFPAMELEHSLDKYNDSSHTRFHASSEKSAKIKMYVWPTLLDSNTKTVLLKGVVWT